MSSLKTINWKAGFYVLIGISFALTHKLNAKPFDLSTSFSGKLGVGVGAALFWRGAWYALDDRLYPGEPLKSAVASFVMGASGLAASSLSLESIGKSVEKFPLPIKSATQFASVYSVALSNVLLWRGTWMLWDLAYEGCGLSEDEYKATDAGHATSSGIASHSLATGGLFAAGVFASVLAPPAGICIIRDATIKGSIKNIFKPK